MSGHSKWSQIKHKKGIADHKRGQLFSKLSKAISIAARRGPDPDQNLDLKNAIEYARTFDLPKDNIERAIKRVTDKDSAQLEELVIEAVGPSAVNLIIIAITDNKNRTISEIKKTLLDGEAKMAQQGSVMWAFDKTAEGFVPKYPLEIDEAAKIKLDKLLETLDDNEDVQEIYTNY
ncbi:MAG: YebC/PmpR family DNA-binding transcriptional regulator [bacterium]|nr:YebC/PmpR family DNA-binding transcriptional regulator [bacterium]